MDCLWSQHATGLTVATRMNRAPKSKDLGHPAQVLWTWGTDCLWSQHATGLTVATRVNRAPKSKDLGHPAGAGAGRYFPVSMNFSNLARSASCTDRPVASITVTKSCMVIGLGSSPPIEAMNGIVAAR